jgi:hypothetical protein
MSAFCVQVGYVSTTFPDEHLPYNDVLSPGPRLLLGSTIEMVSRGMYILDIRHVVVEVQTSFHSSLRCVISERTASNKTFYSGDDLGMRDDGIRIKVIWPYSGKGQDAIPLEIAMCYF